ncbi:MAG TPA: SRPBCC family protein [Xanthomonadaceae bacterium]|nr:SRPBCC family protein [Xanthomonadaceae bacterium]
MWTRDAATEIDAPAARLWALFTDLAGWPAWNAGIEQIALHGPFRDGTVFSLRPPGMDAFDGTLAEVVPGRGFTDETVFGATVVRVRHVIEPLAGDRVRVVFRTEAEGPGAAEIGAAASADFPDVLRALKRHAEHEARDGRHDFDFLHGTWRVDNRRLRQRLAGCTAWDRFDARVTCTPLLGGIANLETHVFDWNGGRHGLALRLYSPTSRRWSIRWANGADGTLEPPVHGGFDGDVGLFFGEDVHAGRPVRVRFTWTRLDADRARWEQAFSADGGDTWEPNWVMDFARDA